MQWSKLPENSVTDAADSLLMQEQLRCKALVDRDFATLERLLDEALTYTHSTGEVHNRASYLEYVKGPAKLLSAERSSLELQIYGNVALMLGVQTNTVQPPAPVAAVTVHSQVQQVWLNCDNQWRLLAFQATRLSASKPLARKAP